MVWLGGSNDLMHIRAFCTKCKKIVIILQGTCGLATEIRTLQESSRKRFLKYSVPKNNLTGRAG